MMESTVNASGADSGNGKASLLASLTGDIDVNETSAQMSSSASLFDTSTSANGMNRKPSEDTAGGKVVSENLSNGNVIYEDGQEEDLFGAVTSVGSTSNSIGSGGTGGLNGTSTMASSNRLAGNSLLSSSGLLMDNGNDNSSVKKIHSVSGGGGGLFDEVDEQERLQLEAEEERRRIQMQQEMERQRQEQLAREKEQKLAEEAERRRRLEAEAAAAAAHAGAGHDIGHGMQDLSLDDPPLQPHSNANSNVSADSDPFYRPGMNTNVNMNSMQDPLQSPMQYQNQQHDNRYNQEQQPPSSTIQQAGFGGASYYYSTSGNVQQVHQDPRNAPTAPSSANSVVSTSNSVVPSYAHRSQLRQAHSQNQYNQNTQPYMQQNHPPTMANPGTMPPNNTNNLAPPNSPGVSALPPSFLQNHQFPNNPNRPIRTAGMHNTQPLGHSTKNTTTSKLSYNPESFKPLYGNITVSDPILVQSPGLFSGPPHWSYAITVRNDLPVEGQKEYSAVVSSVRRRFRHFCALEERMRSECCGAILPPRPDKHPTRAIEEVTSRQSAQFALQRATELEMYLNALRQHPLSGKSHALKLFLTLPDHIGTAWPEVSSSILTRITEVGSNTAVKVAEGTSHVISELSTDNQAAAGEDNAELLALASTEGLRMGAVLQAVPKINGAIALIKEQGERIGVIGLESQKLAKDVFAIDQQELAIPFEVLSSGLLRSGRRTKRLAVELGAAAQPFHFQYKICKYERMAFADRREALARRRDARKEADGKAQKLVMNQNSLQTLGKIGMLEKLEMQAAYTDEIAVEAFQHAEDVGKILQLEVERITELREREWSHSLKVLAANMKEACTERVAIWESCRESFLQSFPLHPNTSSDYSTVSMGGNPSIEDQNRTVGDAPSTSAPSAADLPEWYIGYRQERLHKPPKDGWDSVSFY